MGPYEIKGNWVKCSEDDFANLVEIGEKFSDDMKTDIFEHPSIKDVVFEVTDKRGRTEVINCHLFDSDHIPAAVKADRECYSKNAIHICFYYLAGRSLHETFESYMWVDTTNLFCGGYKAAPAFEQRTTQQDIFNHEEDGLYGFLAFQYLLLHNADTVSSRKEYRKGLKSGSSHIPLVGPYTKPGKVMVFNVNLSNDEQQKIFSQIKNRVWHCPSWGVRGHYRHYKSGRVVYVKPYIKGKDRTAYEGREYVLNGRNSKWN